MTTTQDNEVRRAIEVVVPQDTAFRIFTEQFDRIKPRMHNLLAVPIVETVLEPRAGGDVYDRGEDGSICRWARVLTYEPPSRLVLAWCIGATWELETDPARFSEVEIEFVALDAEHTRVELTHTHLERHGEMWPAARAALDAEQGWPLYLERYAELAAGAVA